MHLTRNDDLVPGRTTAPDFIYTTSDVSFTNPLHPTIVSDAKIDIASLGTSDGNPVQRSLNEQLMQLFTTLFANRYAGDVTIQVEVTYSYAFNTTLTPMAIDLPVVLQPPLKVAVGAEGTSTVSLAEMTGNLTQSIQTWATKLSPSTMQALLKFDLKIMSNLTQQPMPLLEFTELTLPLEYIDPALVAKQLLAV